MSRTRQKQHKRLVLIARSNKFINRLIDAGRVQADGDGDGFAFDSAEDGLEYLYSDGEVGEKEIANRPIEIDSNDGWE